MTGNDAPFPYESAQAFRSALRDRLAASARAGGHGLDELQRQFAYDRLLARAFSGTDADHWVLKGAGALLARLPDAAAYVVMTRVRSSDCSPTGLFITARDSLVAPAQERGDDTVWSFVADTGSMGDIASTPPPPYVAVIFTSLRTGGVDGGDDGYAAMSARMVELAAQQPGYLGMESAREDVGLTVSYWATERDARAWKQIGEHLGAQQVGRERWYASYRVRVATVTRDYGSRSTAERVAR